VKVWWIHVTISSIVGWKVRQGPLEHGPLSSFNIRVCSASLGLQRSTIQRLVSYKSDRKNSFSSITPSQHDGGNARVTREPMEPTPTALPDTYRRKFQPIIQSSSTQGTLCRLSPRQI
jgi:hypothetical protein